MVSKRVKVVIKTLEMHVFSKVRRGASVGLSTSMHIFEFRVGWYKLYKDLHVDKKKGIQGLTAAIMFQTQEKGPLPFRKTGGAKGDIYLLLMRKVVASGQPCYERVGVGVTVSWVGIASGTGGLRADEMIWRMDAKQEEFILGSSAISKTRLNALSLSIRF